MIERCTKKLATWKANCLSFGGQITVIKATLSNLPIYYLYTFFKIPEGVAQEIESSQKQFLWQGNSDFKPHLSNWDIVSTGKKNAGLALRGILKRKVAVLGKCFEDSISN